MMAILFVGLAAHLRGGIDVWRRATHASEMLQRRRVAFERMERDFANAFVYDEREDAQPAPIFEAEALAWFTLEAAVTDGPAVRFIRYGCSEMSGAKGFWRLAQPVSAVRLGREGSPELLLPDCKSLAIRYAYLPEQMNLSSTNGSITFDWHPAWNDGHKRELPRLVEVSVELTDGTVLRRLFALPAGVMKAFEPPTP